MSVPGQAPSGPIPYQTPVFSPQPGPSHMPPGIYPQQATWYPPQPMVLPYLYPKIPPIPATAKFRA